MKRSMFAALLFPLAIAGCSADATSDSSGEPGGAADDQAAAAPAPVEGVATQRAAGGALDPSKYCLPGETVKCTLGPPPVCSCVPATTTTTATALYAW